MEQRIESISGDTGSARLQLAELVAAQRRAPAARSDGASAAQAAEAAAPAVDSFERGPSEPPPAFPPMIHMRARIAAAMGNSSPAQAGLDLLGRAETSTHELSQILSQLTALVGDGTGSADLQRMRIQVQQILNTLRFQQGPSIDGSNLGDTLRADLEADGAPRPDTSEAA